MTARDLEKSLSPSPRESDSVTARGDGRMERASHGAEGLLRFALLCFCGEWSQPLVGVEEVKRLRQGYRRWRRLGRGRVRRLGVFLDDAGRLLALDVAEFGWLDL